MIHIRAECSRSLIRGHRSSKNDRNPKTKLHLEHDFRSGGNVSRRLEELGGPARRMNERMSLVLDKFGQIVK